MKKNSVCMYAQFNMMSVPCCCDVCSRLIELNIPDMYTHLLDKIYTFLSNMRFYCDHITLKKLIYNILKFDKKINTENKIKLYIFNLCLEDTMVDPIFCLNVCYEMIELNVDVELYQQISKLIENKLL